MSRSIWKGPFIDRNLLDKLKKPLNKKIKVRKLSKTWSRRSTILPQLVGCNIEVYNGKSFYSFTISEDMIGHKLGEFSLTRTRPTHKVKVKK
jgi:small subunit ribosomal protein S19